MRLPLHRAVDVGAGSPRRLPAFSPRDAVPAEIGHPQGVPLQWDSMEWRVWLQMSPRYCEGASMLKARTRVFSSDLTRLPFEVTLSPKGTSARSLSIF